ncbi:hypothetical protein D3C79_931100 [compost metagenome]
MVEVHARADIDETLQPLGIQVLGQGRADGLVVEADLQVERVVAQLPHLCHRNAGGFEQRAGGSVVTAGDDQGRRRPGQVGAQQFQLTFRVVVAVADQQLVATALEHFLHGAEGFREERVDH